MRDSVALAFDGESGPPQRLFDRVYAHMARGKHTCQFSRNRRLAHAGEATQDDQHGAHGASPPGHGLMKSNCTYRRMR